MSFRYGALTVLLGFEFNAASKLLKAADQGDIDTVRRVLERKPQLAVFTGFSGSLSPLHRAVGRRDESMCREILKIASEFSKSHGRAEDKGESLVLVVANQKSHRGLTPLMMACESGSMPIVKMLLDFGADPREYDQYTSRTCLHYACLAGKASIVDFLTGSSVTVDHDGSRLPLRECVMSDVQVGSSKYIDQRSFGGLTALHFAAVASSLECARILLQRGAAIMVKTDGDAFIGEDYLNPGSTPLHIAVLTNNISIAHTIISSHAAMMGEGPSFMVGSGGGENGERRGRRAWEGSSRTDIRSVRNSHRKLPYHLARERRRREMMHLVDPRINADFALDQARDAHLGLGAMRLSSICSQAIQSSLLCWLDAYEKNREEEKRTVEAEIETVDACTDEAPSVHNCGNFQEVGLPKIPAILTRKATAMPNYANTIGIGVLRMEGGDGSCLSPTFLDELSPIATFSSTFTSGAIHGHHATADDLLLDRISTQLMFARSGDRVEGAPGDGRDGHRGGNMAHEAHSEHHNNNTLHMVPTMKRSLIRVHSESGLSQLAAFGRRRLGALNNSPALPAGGPDTPDAMIKSDSFENDHEAKDAESCGTGDKGSISGGSTSGSMAGIECGVCLDATVEIEFACSHQLCLDCSRSLTLQKKRPPICPFCRQEVYQFHKVSG
jgi:ankyrin repeat protein